MMAIFRRQTLGPSAAAMEFSVALCRCRHQPTGVTKFSNRYELVKEIKKIIDLIRRGVSEE